MNVQTHALILTPRDEQLALPNITVNKIFRAPESTVPRHSHAHPNVVLCLSGNYKETIAGRWVDVSPSTLVCRPAGEPHITRYGLRPTSCFVFEVLPDALRKLKLMTTLLDEPSVSQSGMGGVLAVKLNHELRARDCVTPLAVEALFYELIAHATRQQERQTTARLEWLNQVKGLLHDAYRSSLCLSDIADAVDVHPSHLCKAFRRHFGKTPGEYVRNLRIMYALHLLKSEMPLAEIAVASGFCDQSHFSRAFKREIGISPGRYCFAERTTKKQTH